MEKVTVCLAFLLLVFVSQEQVAAQDRILIVHDELPQMNFLAGLLHEKCQSDVEIKTQNEMPADLSGYKCVVVFIHGKLFETPEEAFIAYTRAGGRLLVLHHSISSGKRNNKYWFDFLGVKLPEGDWDKGGYKWIEPVAQKVVNVNPGHYITSHHVEYEGKVAFQTDAVKSGDSPYFTLKQNSEVYLNHTFTDGDEKTLLLGFLYDGKEIGGKTIMQHTSGWLKKVGKGTLIYLQPGHSLEDMRTTPFQQMLINAIRWSPEPK